MRAGDFPALQRVNLNGAAVTDAGMKGVGRSSHLRSLRLNGTEVTDAGVRELKGLAIRRDNRSGERES